MLILVRHALPAYGPDQPAHEWELAGDGHQGARSLRHVLQPAAVLVSSREPKARQTLQPCGRVNTDARFGEVRRDEPYEGDFRSRRFAYVTGTEHPGWEPRAEVVARFDAGITFWQGQAGDRPLVVATHGMAMTLWLNTVARIDPGAFWSRLRLPDPYEVDLEAQTVDRIVSPLLFQTQA